MNWLRKNRSKRSIERMPNDPCGSWHFECWVFLSEVSIAICRMHRSGKADLRFRLVRSALGWPERCPSCPEWAHGYAKSRCFHSRHNPLKVTARPRVGAEQFPVLDRLYIWRSWMLSRALILAAVAFALGCFGAIPADAQNLEAGKAPSQIFSSTCSLCHKSARGLLKSVAAGITARLPAPALHHEHRHGRGYERLCSVQRRRERSGRRRKSDPAGSGIEKRRGNSTGACRRAGRTGPASRRRVKRQSPTPMVWRAARRPVRRRRLSRRRPRVRRRLPSAEPRGRQQRPRPGCRRRMKRGTRRRRASPARMSLPRPNPRLKRSRPKRRGPNPRRWTVRAPILCLPSRLRLPRPRRGRRPRQSSRRSR